MEECMKQCHGPIVWNFNAQELEKGNAPFDKHPHENPNEANDKRQNKPYFNERDSVVSFHLFHLISLACQEHTASFTGTVAF